MEKFIVILWSVWFCLSCQANDCPSSLTFGNPEWPNKIELIQDELTRVFYFEQARLTKNNTILELNNPVVIPVSGTGKGPSITFTFREILMEGEESITGERELSAVMLNTREILCMEIESDFGRSAISYNNRMVVEKMDEDTYHVNIKVNSTGDGTTLVADLRHVSFSEAIMPEPSSNIYQTSNGAVEGTIHYNQLRSTSKNKGVGLHVNLHDEDVSSFTVSTFNGNEGIHRLATFGNKFVKINQFGEGMIAIDLYEFEQEVIAEVEGQTFFDFALGEILIQEKKPSKLIAISGPIAVYVEENNVAEDLGTYYFDAKKAVKKGYHYEVTDPIVEEKTVLNAWDHYSFKKLPAITLSHKSRDFTVEEKWEGDRLYTALTPTTQGAEKLDCDRILEKAYQALAEKYDRKEPIYGVMRFIAQEAAKEGLDIGDVSRMTEGQIENLLKEKSRELCGEGKKILSEPRESSATISNNGGLVFREYFPQAPTTFMTVSREGGKMVFVAENEDQGRQTLELPDHSELPDMSMFFQIVGGIDFEEGKTYALEFQDYNLSQSQRFSSAPGREDRNILKQTISNVKAEFQLEVLGVEDVNGKEAYKIAMHHKAFGEGHLLLSIFMGFRYGHSPFKVGAYLYVDKSNGTLLKVNSENDEVVFD